MCRKTQFSNLRAEEGPFFSIEHPFLNPSEILDDIHL
jgi:hypothetical protein